MRMSAADRARRGRLLISSAPIAEPSAAIPNPTTVYLPPPTFTDGVGTAATVVVVVGAGLVVVVVLTSTGVVSSVTGDGSTVVPPPEETRRVVTGGSLCVVTVVVGTGGIESTCAMAASDCAFSALGNGA